MSVWDSYPVNYRGNEINAVLNAISAGESVSLVGLSGSGKSNLLGFLANQKQHSTDGINFLLVDCNQLGELSSKAVFEGIKQLIEKNTDPSSSLGEIIGQYIHSQGGVLCIILDRFDALEKIGDETLYNKLRALRDRFKYELTYLVATRQPLDPTTELAELFIGNTLWLGPLTKSDAYWSVEKYAQRRRQSWPNEVIEKIFRYSRGYPSLVRALCEVYADLGSLNEEMLHAHPAVYRRVNEFWMDEPDDKALEQSGLSGHPLLIRSRLPVIDTTRLTAKEYALLQYFLKHADQVCEKDNLIKAVWPEDAVYGEGVRDDSLAQLIRRLRRKIEPNPDIQRFIHTVPGRGYRFEGNDLQFKGNIIG